MLSNSPPRDGEVLHVPQHLEPEAPGVWLARAYLTQAGLEHLILGGQALDPIAQRGDLSPKLGRLP